MVSVWRNFSVGVTFPTLGCHAVQRMKNKPQPQNFQPHAQNRYRSGWAFWMRFFGSTAEPLGIPTDLTPTLKNGNRFYNATFCT